MLELYFFNVGHGDSIAIKFPNNEWGVVDCNRSDKQRIPNVLKFLKKENIQILKFVCITHPHLDHFDGMETIVEEYSDNIEDFILYNNGRSCLFEKQTSSLTQALETFSTFKNKNFILACAKETYQVGDIEIKLLNPDHDVAAEFFEKSFSNKELNILNKESIVMYFEYAGVKILLNGDVPVKQCEKFQEYIKSDIIKISHHGSIHNNPQNLLVSLSNKECISIISSDANKRFPTIPHKDVLNCLEQNLKSNILKTYELNKKPVDTEIPELETNDLIDAISEDIDEDSTDGYFKVTISSEGNISYEKIYNI